MDQPQMPRPTTTTDGKQTADHLYSTRSKAKRTSFCETDDDSSGSQAQQPPLKRQMRLRAKQANKSAGIKKCVTIPDSNSVNTNTNIVDENTPAQTALQNDLVLESVLSYLIRSDLLICRVVNKQWQSEATKELRRRKLVIKFSFLSQENVVSRNTVIETICQRLSECRTPSLLSSVQVKIDYRNDLESAGVTSFFNTVGNQVKHLTLHLDYWREGCPIGSSSLMTDLQNLLSRQTPNLEFLEVKFKFPHRWADNRQALDSSDSPQNDNNELLLLPNLKTFIVTGKPHPKFFADVINAAANLRSVGGGWLISAPIKYIFTPHIIPLWGYSSACIGYFIGAEGRGKIHLLKSFRIYLTEFDSHFQWNDVDIELMETFLTEHKQNLQLETFECVSKVFDDPSFAPRIVRVINKMLDCSSGSLQKLRIEPAKWFEELLIIPRLPKLQEIWFDCFRSSMEGLDHGGFFPHGLNINISFPNVSSIVLLSCSVPLFHLFLSRMEIEMTEPVPSVRRIVMIDAEKDGSCVSPLASDFHHIFPNLLSVSYVSKGKYYII